MVGAFDYTSLLTLEVLFFFYNIIIIIEIKNSLGNGHRK